MVFASGRDDNSRGLIKELDKQPERSEFFARGMLFCFAKFLKLQNPLIRGGGIGAAADESPSGADKRVLRSFAASRELRVHVLMLKFHLDGGVVVPESEVICEQDMVAEVVDQLGQALHELCQPLTTLQCRLEIAGLVGTADAYREAVDLGLAECARLVDGVHAMREILQASRQPEDGAIEAVGH